MKKNDNLQGAEWNDEDYLLLAETVLRHVRSGGTIIDACKEVEEVTEGRRTRSACKFKWHMKLKDQYKAAYELAKQEGQKKRAISKKRVNQGERYEDIVKNILDVEEEREITPEDILVLVKKYKQQEDDKTNQNTKDEKKLDKVTRENSRVKKELKETKEALVELNKRYNELKDALNVLKKAGVQINMPEPDTVRYVVNKDGTVEKI